MKYTKSVFTISGVTVGSMLLLTSVAFADTQQTQATGVGRMNHAGLMRGHAPGVVGIVSKVSGSSITITSKGWGANATEVTYTVDASKATITKNGTDALLSDIVIGDTLMVEGTVSGNTITALKIHDGQLKGPRGDDGYRSGVMGGTSAMARLSGNGQPVVAGSVASISGNILTVTTKAGPSYSIDASSATIFKDGATSSLSEVSTGDSVVVQGSVTGTSVVASSILDQGVPHAVGGNLSSGSREKSKTGFLGMIGGFLHRYFGFF